MTGLKCRCTSMADTTDAHHWQAPNTAEHDRYRCTSMTGHRYWCTSLTGSSAHRIMSICSLTPCLLWLYSIYKYVPVYLCTSLLLLWYSKCPCLPQHFSSVIMLCTKCPCLSHHNVCCDFRMHTISPVLFASVCALRNPPTPPPPTGPCLFWCRYRVLSVPHGTTIEQKTTPFCCRWNWLHPTPISLLPVSYRSDNGYLSALRYLSAAGGGDAYVS